MSIGHTFSDFRETHFFYVPYVKTKAQMDLEEGRMERKYSIWRHMENLFALIDGRTFPKVLDNF